MTRDSSEKISDEELVVGSLLGDFEAFDGLVRRYRNAVVSVAQQVVGTRAIAEEVAQESFLIAFKELPQLADISRFAGWLCAIARHRARRVAAREGRCEAQEPSALDLIIRASSPALSVHPEEEVARRAEHNEIGQALNSLPPEHQIVLRLRYYEDWKVAQIATFLSLPITTVKWRLHQGRELMRRRLTRPQLAEPMENDYERDKLKEHRCAAPACRSVADHQPGPRGQPDGLPGKRPPKFDSAVQPHSANGGRTGH